MENEHPSHDDATPAPPGTENPYESPAAVYPDVPGVIEQDKDARNMGMLCHLTGLSSFLGVPGFVGPLIIWLLRKDQQPFVDDQGKESLNFQITMILAVVVLSIVGLVTCGIGYLLLLVLLVALVVFCIIGSVKASNGEYYRYPMTIRLIK